MWKTQISKGSQKYFSQGRAGFFLGQNLSIMAGFSARGAQIWKDSCEKENKLRLRWFLKNEKNLERDSDFKDNTEKMKELYAAQIESQKQLFRDTNRYPAHEVPDPDPPIVDPAALGSIMRPVPPEIKALIFSGLFLFSPYLISVFLILILFFPP